MFQAIQAKSGSGYKLVDKGMGVYQLLTPKDVFTGSLKQVCTYSVLELGFSISEIELGILEMEKHFHNAAEYGIFKRFMWTYDTEEKNPNYNTKH
ncbi:MAG: hypothetical protein HC840_00380 [Leptolyngbyaceae cyanobacterium RM2_2_4]|nr:hypothetical protein [Leptolyngbyaceae cyanobacterium RM2_2_4]